MEILTFTAAQPISERVFTATNKIQYKFNCFLTDKRAEPPRNEITRKRNLLFIDLCCCDQIPVSFRFEVFKSLAILVLYLWGKIHSALFCPFSLLILCQLELFQVGPLALNSCAQLPQIAFQDVLVRVRCAAQNFKSNL